MNKEPISTTLEFSICARHLAFSTACVLSVLLLLLPAQAQSNTPNPPSSFQDGFEQGYTMFDDGVGVIHLRQSGSTAEKDYAQGIPASQGRFYARLAVQSWLQNGCDPNAPQGSPGCGINDDQPPAVCTPGAPMVLNSVVCDGPFTEWGLPYGGYDGNFDSGVPIGHGAQTSNDIYLDTSFAAAARTSAGTTDYRFDWDSDLLDANGQFLQDYIFNVATGQTTDLHCASVVGGSGFYVVEASTNSQRPGANAHNPTPPNPPQACLAQSGWYTFQHTFRPDHNNNLEVDMVILDSHKRVVAAWALHPACMGTQATEGLCTAGQPLPFSAVGYNFLGWFPDQEINNLAIDNVQRKSTAADEDEGAGEDKDHNHFQFDNSSSHPENSEMTYNDPSSGMDMQSVNGVSSATYSTGCVNLAGNAVVSGNPGYLYTFTACDLSLLGTGIGTYTINMTGPLGFLYQKSGALTSGYVSIHTP